MKKLLFSALLASAFLTFQSCSDKPKDSTEVAEESNEAKVDSGMTSVGGESEGDKTDATDFAMKAAEGSMFEIEAGKLAQQKGTNPMVKEMAAMIVADHTKASDELMALAKTKNITLPTALSQDKMDKIKDLNEKSGKDFDEKFIDMMEDDHEKDVKMFRKASEDLEDSELKTWAGATLPTLEKHLSMVKDGDEKMDHAGH